MFAYSPFNKDISKWHLGSDTYISGMFKDCPLENKPEFKPVKK